jgi:hypothetical protein
MESRAKWEKLPVEFPQVAYELTDRIIALYASEEIRQKTMAMEVDEFRDWLTMHMTDVLSGHPRLAPPSPFNKPAEPEPIVFVGDPLSAQRSSKQIINEMIQNTPPEVRHLYEQQLGRGLTEMEACEASLQLLAQQRSEAA